MIQCVSIYYYSKQNGGFLMHENDVNDAVRDLMSPLLYVRKTLWPVFKTTAWTQFDLSAT